MTNQKTDSKATQGDSPKADKTRRHRSPSYPAFALSEVLKLTSEFYDQERQHAALIPDALQHWGFSEKSSGGLLSVSALLQFGLMTEEGANKTRKVKLSELAMDYLRQKATPGQELGAVLRRIALNPPIHKTLWDKYGDDLPSDTSIKSFLQFDLKFNPDAADKLIKEYKDTLALAKPTTFDTVGEGETDELVAEKELKTKNMQQREETIPPAKPPESELPGATKKRDIREFLLPLPGGTLAAIKVPFPMTESEFTSLTGILTALKDGLVGT